MPMKEKKTFSSTNLKTTDWRLLISVGQPGNYLFFILKSETSKFLSYNQNECLKFEIIILEHDFQAFNKLYPIFLNSFSIKTSDECIFKPFFSWYFIFSIIIQFADSDNTSMIQKTKLIFIYFIICPGFEIIITQYITVFGSCISFLYHNSKELTYSIWPDHAIQFPFIYSPLSPWLIHCTFSFILLSFSCF